MNNKKLLLSQTDGNKTVPLKNGFKREKQV